MARKQPSGAKNRRKAKERAVAAGILMPRADITLDDVSSLSGLTSTRFRYLRDWLKKKLSTDDFAVFLKTLAEFRADAVARIQERDIENDTRLVEALERHEARAAGLSLTTLPALEQSPAEAPQLIEASVEVPADRGAGGDNNHEVIE